MTVGNLTSTGNGTNMGFETAPGSGSKFEAIGNSIVKGVEVGAKSAYTNNLVSSEALQSNGLVEGQSIDPSILGYLERTKSKEEEKIFKKLGHDYQVHAQPAYGVQPPVSVPAYGVMLPDLNISVEEMKENIATLDSAIKTLNNSWGKETASLAKQLSDSWAGKDCAEYIEKLTKMDKKVDNTIKALELLKKTYQKALDLVLEKQKSSVTVIVNADLEG